MITNFIDQPGKEDELRKILSEWDGTPFRHWAGVKKLGCDCIHFILRVYQELGFRDMITFKMPMYSKDWHLNSHEEIMLKFLRTMPSIKEIGLSRIKNGDICIMKHRWVASHAGIYCDDKFYHSVIPIGVIKVSWESYRIQNPNQYGFRAVIL